MTDPNKGIVGRVWAVLSIRNILNVKDVASTSNCSLFSSQEEAVAFAKRVADLKKNWVIHVAPIPILSDHKIAILPEEGVPFSEN